MGISEKKQVVNPNHPLNETGQDWFYFNVHNLVTFRVERSAATASLFTDIFGPFITGAGGHYDLTITEELEPFVDGAYGEAHGETDFYYNSTGVFLESPGVQIFLDEDGFHLHGSSELLVMALPLIDRLMVTRQAAMVHAMTVAFRGKGICMPAWGGTGKTSTM